MVCPGLLFSCCLAGGVAAVFFGCRSGPIDRAGYQAACLQAVSIGSDCDKGNFVLWRLSFMRSIHVFCRNLCDPTGLRCGPPRSTRHCYRVGKTGRLTLIRMDFSTPRFLSDAIVSNLDASCWSQGSICNSGPNSNRMLTYRFYGDRPIADVQVTLEQWANSVR